MTHAIDFLIIIVIGFLAFIIGKKLAKSSVTKITTNTLSITSIQAIAELAVLEYDTEGIKTFSEKEVKLLYVVWKKGLLKYRAKLKIGFDINQLSTDLNHSQKIIRIMLPEPKILSCEIYNREFYKLPREKAENVPLKFDIQSDFTANEVLELDNEAKKDAKDKVDKFHVLDKLQLKTMDAFERILTLSYPSYRIEVLITNKENQESQNKLISESIPKDPPPALK
jgi:hypothetical protein